MVGQRVTQIEPDVHEAHGPGLSTHARNLSCHLPVVICVDIDGLLEHRRAKDEFFAKSEHAPLTPSEQAVFTGLIYFDPDPGLVFTLNPQPADNSEITVQTSDGQERVYRRVSTVAFDVAGQPVSLALYSTGHPGLFIPFRDATSGKMSYGAGRYLDIDLNADGTVTVDFNLAYNPYCAYSDSYSCPIPPVENWLPIPIEAGERDWPV